MITEPEATGAACRTASPRHAMSRPPESLATSAESRQAGGEPARFLATALPASASAAPRIPGGRRSAQRRRQRPRGRSRREPGSGKRVRSEGGRPEGGRALARCSGRAPPRREAWLEAGLWGQPQPCGGSRLGERAGEGPGRLETRTGRPCAGPGQAAEEPLAPGQPWSPAAGRWMWGQVGA